MKWLKRLFGKLRSSAERDARTTPPPAEAKPAAEPEKVETTAAEVDEVDVSARESTVEQPAEAGAPADPAINTLDSERQAALLPESPPAEKTPAAEDTPAAEEAAAGKKSAETEEPAGEPAVEPVAAEREAAASTKAAKVVDAPAAGEEGPFGPGSATPLAGGAAPGEEFTVKGKRSSKLFHTAESPYFGRTKADVWFRTPADAENAGFAAWNHKKKAAAK